MQNVFINAHSQDPIYERFKKNLSKRREFVIYSRELVRISVSPAEISQSIHTLEQVPKDFSKDALSYNSLYKEKYKANQPGAQMCFIYYCTIINHMNLLLGQIKLLKNRLG